MCDDWLPVPTKWVLTGTAVHLHRLSLTQNFNTYYPYLSPDERLRVARFVRAEDRRRYTVARGMLRLLIGRYENLRPEQVQFVHNDFGKPLLFHQTDLQFNVSHSQELALLAFTRGCAIGVDVEFRRPLADADDIAQHHFSSYEYNIFHSLPPSQKHQAFFNCWTRKEAFIKAIGEGLSHPLHTFDVTFLPGDEARFLRIEGEDVTTWGLQAIHPHPDFAAALAVARPQWTLTCYQ
ncbi:MAG: 4'-phosphopantetheinyl transferase superfamily protein [Ardenticatenaceae bacterium]|nr:4'-phosphopantetheinyl transferase superfamily protein [Ardenticatenaceae bacterium]